MKRGYRIRVNDTTREPGGVLGAAVVGAVFAALNAPGFDDAPGRAAL